MFCDEVRIKVVSGKGGDGGVSFRREKYIPKGGPDGGNGGKGGDVVFVTNPHLNTLYHLRSKRTHKATSGEYGMGNNRHGGAGEDLIIEVPVGTVIHNAETDAIIADLSRPDLRFIAVEGGRGGYGNSHFTSSTRQAPDFAELGDRATELEVRLELKLVADVGIIGLPSVGKSTLISVISNARPKIGDYPFTTLIPNLGVVAHKGYSYVVSDIPGLIEGASEGKGLGHQFLRHIERCSLLVHLVDAGHLDAITHDIEVINKELEKHSPLLATKKQVLAINKADLLDDELKELLRAQLTEKGYTEVFFLSAVTHQGVEELLNSLMLLVQEYKKANPVQSLERELESEGDVTRLPDGTVLLRPLLKADPERWSIDEVDGKVVIRGARIEQLARMSDLSKPGALLRLYDILSKLGIAPELERRRLFEGDVFSIGDVDIEYIEKLP